METAYGLTENNYVIFPAPAGILADCPECWATTYSPRYDGALCFWQT